MYLRNLEQQQRASELSLLSFAPQTGIPSLTLLLYQLPLLIHSVALIH